MAPPVSGRLLEALRLGVCHTAVKQNALRNNAVRNEVLHYPYHELATELPL
jgi:hypothetical protein